MAVLDKAVFRMVEGHFYSYYTLLDRVTDYRESIMFGQGDSIEPGGHGTSRHSDPTALKAVRLTSNRDMLVWQRWIRVIERTQERYKGMAKARLIQLRYFEEHGVESACGRLHIDRATYFNWVNEIVVFAALLGVQYGLIEVDKAS